MSNGNPNIIWAYDSNGQLGALPASPLLLPALLIYGVALLLTLVREPTGMPPTEALSGRVIADNRRRYIELTTIASVRALTNAEEMELLQIQHPFGLQYPPITYLE